MLFKFRWSLNHIAIYYEYIIMTLINNFGFFSGKLIEGFLYTK